jgi:hypothetical protein
MADIQAGEKILVQVTDFSACLNQGHLPQIKGED